METIEAIMSRRSIRKFTSQVVPEEEIDILLRAGMQAPSAGNGQPWHFVVIVERSLLDQVPTFHPYANMILEAPLAILVCADMRKPKRPHYCEEDCSAATENILLAAHARGLGAVWLGIAHNQEREDGIRHLVELPAGVQPISLVVIGYPAEKKPRESRYKRERVHRNKW